MYNIKQLEAMDAACIAGCSPKHMESVIAELIDTAISLRQSNAALVEALEESYEVLGLLNNAMRLAKWEGDTAAIRGQELREKIRALKLIKE